MANKKLYVILLALWFILTGLLSLTNFEFVFAGVILGLLAIAGGILWFLDR